MIPEIEYSNERKLIGIKMKMSLAANKTAELWRSFMPLRNRIGHKKSFELVSMSVYPKNYFSNLIPTTAFDKWAAAEVHNFENIPDEMEIFTIPAGLYAVFHYKGLNTDTGIFQYIFKTWLPNSDYILDNRPHFEVLGEKYKNNNPDSEEEIWIPVQKKT